MGDESKEAILYVNGHHRVLPDGLAHLTLLKYLNQSNWENWTNESHNTKEIIFCCYFCNWN